MGGCLGSPSKPYGQQSGAYGGYPHQQGYGGYPPQQGGYGAPGQYGNNFQPNYGPQGGYGGEAAQNHLHALLVLHFLCQSLQS